MTSALWSPDLFIFLYKSIKDLKDSSAQGVFETIGTLQLRYSAAVYIPMAITTGYDSAVTAKEDGELFENQSCLELRSRLPNGNEAINTTHAFCITDRNTQREQSSVQASDWLLRTAMLFRDSKPVKRFLELPTVSRIQRRQNSCLGQIVFLPGTDTLVSTSNSI